MNYVIIGNSIAAVGTVEGIRKADKTGSITVVGDEKHHVYSRPLISYLLEGKTDEEKMKYRPDSFYEDNGVRLITGVRAEKIDPGKKTVELENGKALPYDKLMVAAGSRPFVIPFDGLDTVKDKFTFMTLDDAKALAAALNPEKRVLIIGAGLIGLKCAEGIHSRCASITVADLAPRILSSVLDDEAADMVRKHMEQKGVKFILGHSAKSFCENTAVMDDGSQVDFDVLVIAMGVRPNTELVSQAGGKVERGIITDENQMTTIPDIYAAGDCVVTHDVSFDGDRILAILPNAYRQGEAAGLSMAGRPSEFADAIPMNAGGFMGLHITTAGTYTGDVYTDRQSGSLKKLFYKDGLLRGFIMVGNVSKAGIYASLIRNRTPLDTVDFELICKEPCLMAFSRKFRDEKLGGIKA